MHLLVSHAGAGSDHPQCQSSIPHLALPKLTELLGLLTIRPPVSGSPDSLTPLRERLRAEQVGLTAADGLLPWAALDAYQLGLTKMHGNAGWAWITPCHLRNQGEMFYMEDPHHLRITSQECDTLRMAMQRYFQEDGITLYPLSDSTWLAHGTVFKDLPTASLERVVCNMINNWVPRQENARHLRRLQNEMQMLLYTHAVNEVRKNNKLAAINAFWVSGTGTLANHFDVSNINQSAHNTPQWNHSLRLSAIHDDGAGWVEAWKKLDATLFAELTQRAKVGKYPLTLTLCGERRAITLELQDKPWWMRVKQQFSASAPQQLVQSL